MSKPTDYDKIKALWYKKLEKQGFRDIETEKGGLKTWSSHFAEKRTQELLQSREPYYYMANQFLNEYKFDNRLDQIIWEYHTNAISARDIVKLLTKTKVAKTNRQTVWLTIKRLEKAMKAMYMSSYETQHE